MTLPALRDVLTYENDAVLKLYVEKYPGHKLAPEAALREVLKYLWLTQKHAQDARDDPENERFPRNCIMLRSMQEIDDMWHEFILFTQAYTDFCARYFGRYIHHLPNVFDNNPMARAQELEEIGKIVPYVYDHLGEETVRTWFAAYLPQDNAA